MSNTMTHPATEYPAWKLMQRCPVDWCEGHLEPSETDTDLGDGWVNDGGEVTRIHRRPGTYFCAVQIEHFDGGKHGFEKTILSECHTLELSPHQAREAAEELAHLAALTA